MVPAGWGWAGVAGSAGDKGATGAGPVDPRTTSSGPKSVSAEPVPLPEHAGVLLATGPLDGELLPPDGAVWLRSRSPDGG
jgi:hypothetical protein